MRTLASERNENLLIEVDGGVNQHDLLALLKAGADVLVAGNAVFASEDPEKTIEEMKKMSFDSITV